MKEKELSTTDEVSLKNSIWDERNETHRLLSQAAKTLSHKTGHLSWCIPTVVMFITLEWLIF
jgi:heat-inducible transcriptional repressor